MKDKRLTELLEKAQEAYDQGYSDGVWFRRQPGGANFQPPASYSNKVLLRSLYLEGYADGISDREARSLL